MPSGPKVKASISGRAGRGAIAKRAPATLGPVTNVTGPLVFSERRRETSAAFSFSTPVPPRVYDSSDFSRFLRRSHAHNQRPAGGAIPDPHLRRYATWSRLAGETLQHGLWEGWSLLRTHELPIKTTHLLVSARSRLLSLLDGFLSLFWPRLRPIETHLPAPGS